MAPAIRASLALAETCSSRSIEMSVAEGRTAQQRAWQCSIFNRSIYHGVPSVVFYFLSRLEFAKFNVVLCEVFIPAERFIGVSNCQLVVPEDCHLTVTTGGVSLITKKRI